jgi:hypothetical protein
MVNDAVVLEESRLDIVRRLARSAATHVGRTGDQATGCRCIRDRTSASASRRGTRQGDHGQSDKAPRFASHDLSLTQDRTSCRDTVPALGTPTSQGLSYWAVERLLNTSVGIGARDVTTPLATGGCPMARQEDSVAHST